MTSQFDPELVDAYLDGELSGAALVAFEADLATSADLRREVESVGGVRAAVRALPEVDPPFGFYERVLRDQRSAAPLRRSLSGFAASVVAVAAAWILVLSVGSGLGVIDRVPAVGDFADRHAAAVEAMPDPAVGAGYDPMPMDDAADVMPESGDMPMKMTAAYEGDGVVHLMYASGGEMVSVFRQESTADLGELDDGEMMDLRGGDAWHGVVDDMDVLVAVRGAATYTVVGDPSTMPAMTGLVEHLPMTDRSWGDRARGAARDLLDTFGLR